MADITGTKISELPAASSPGDSDVLAGVQSGTTKKFNLPVLLAWIKGRISPADIGAVPTSRTVNGNALTGNITLDADDVGAAEPGDIPSASDADPAMDGTASAGSSPSWARGDHVHPSDTGRAAFALGNNFGVCSTAAATAAKEVTIPGITALTEGLSIRVLFANNVTDSNPTLNVNSLGAVSIKASKTVSIQTPTIMGGSVYDLCYCEDTSVWILLNSRRASLTSYGITSLSDAINADNSTVAATSKAVKTAYGAATTNLAPVEASSTASTNYSIGEHLVLSGVLYEVTVPIASGETITPGTNVTAVTVAGITDALDTRVDALETALDGLVSQLSQI